MVISRGDEGLGVGVWGVGVWGSGEVGKWGVGCGEVGRINKIISCLLSPDDRLLTANSYLLTPPRNF
ncbi:MAG: hypothetical protein EWV80_12880 [Microcystis aeruginosa Ma_QC_B_20070730_S2]|uniref:Uncharacterized protein n=1 Tax=Microcystis aeruginosa Ma_QC_B_20070730_S2 TaxID=2486256 RepID=A0A552DMH3_MICAE|nr:MAG: hypothetical protein EWV80_12880 [Microcystis aeruginosa Ma_QC_B_20070730_S2]